ncbi:hypothetical protein [Chromobacterium alticapitis]|uniref:hypothetical protein n=1 Tax=Chromobacterium alticapitis TaxID=2073169 RepID=UPI0011B068F1|nr:hypothetical protein [Chromobacterium alticapitis]
MEYTGKKTAEKLSTIGEYLVENTYKVFIATILILFLSNKIFPSIYILAGEFIPDSLPSFEIFGYHPFIGINGPLSPQFLRLVSLILFFFTHLLSIETLVWGGASLIADPKKLAARALNSRTKGAPPSSGLILGQRILFTTMAPGMLFLVYAFHFTGSYFHSNNANALMIGVFFPGIALPTFTYTLTHVISFHYYCKEERI